jgi:type VI secretion system secreted protein Hcp
MKKSEKSSPKLFSACCNGQHYAKSTVVMRKAAGASAKQSVFIQYDFQDVMVESIQWSGSTGGDDTPTESVSFAFAKVTITYNVQNTKDGTTTTGATASWDLTAAQAL